MTISFQGINTNNLKNIDYSFVQNTINVVVGPSGSGKSSLVFATIGSLCLDEYNRMSGNPNILNSYRLEGFGELLIPISLQQMNFNRNPRSTIGTYYGLDVFFRHLFATAFSLTPQDFSFNKYKSMCKACRGLGYEVVPDIRKVIDPNKKIEANPFLPWNNTLKNYYDQLLEKALLEFDVEGDMLFQQLSEGQQEVLLYGEGKIKHKINFKQSGRQRVKTSVYKGVLTVLKEAFEDDEALRRTYGRKRLCQDCEGKRLSSKLDAYKLDGLSFGDIARMDFQSLLRFVEEYEAKQSVLTPRQEIQNLVDMQLGYLNLHRSISSLSGGELQRLQLARLLGSKFINLLILLDEPLSNVHVLEKEFILAKMLELKKNNTLIVVEHDDVLLPMADTICALGPGGGSKGGEIIDHEEYVREQIHLKEKILSLRAESGLSAKRQIKIKNETTLNNFKPFELSIPENTLIGISGVSGSGKSTFLKEVLTRSISGFKYISQKPILGNSYSIVGSYLNVMGLIRKLYGDFNGVGQSLFSYHFSGRGGCTTCNGTGAVHVPRYDGKQDFRPCPTCSGTRYRPQVLKYKYSGLDIVEFLSLTIDEVLCLLEDTPEANGNLFDVLGIASRLSLGHLTLGQSIASLSGGENQRIKILGNLNVNRKGEIVGFDEPFKGLDNGNIYKLMLFFSHQIREKNWTILFVEHNVVALNACHYLIDIGKGAGQNGGEIIYSGSLKGACDQKNVSISEYIVTNPTHFD